MEIIFSNAQSLKYEFQYLMSFWGLLVFIFFILFAGKSKKMLSSICVAVLCYTSIILIAYQYVYSNFTSATIKDNTVTLHYVSHPVVVLNKKEIKEIIFGLPGKNSNQCYIRIKDKDKNTYKSAVIKTTPEKCKDLKSKFNQ